MIFLTTTRDNLGQHFLEIEMLSMLSCFFDDNEGQPWTTLLEIEILSLLSMLS